MIFYLNCVQSPDLFELMSKQYDVLLGAVHNSQKSAELRIVITFVASIISVLTGAILAYLFGWVTRKENSKIDSAKSLLTIVQDFENITLEYWSKGYDRNNQSDSLISEAKIKAGFNQLRQYHMHVDIGLDEESKIKLAKLISELFDHATGGNFESTKRKASKYRVQIIASTCAKITPLILKKTFH